jgi:hypothetical protein
LKLHRPTTPFALLYHDVVHVGRALAGAGFLFASLLAAQTQPTEAPSTPVHPSGHTSRHHDASGQKPSEVLAVPSPPPAPPPPNWPINDQPTPAKITWDRPALQIDAQNSSLDQILKDVSSATGAEVEGLTGDERVFGDFGPGNARDVLSQLLQGTSYNIVMVGDQGQGVPRQIILSTRSAGKGQPAARPAPEESEEDLQDYPQYDPQPQPQQPQPAPQPVRPGFPPDQGVPGRPPQQMPQMQQPVQPGQPPTQPQNQ